MVNVDSVTSAGQAVADFWQTLLASISQGVCVFDADGCVGQFNPCLPELLDVPPEFLASGPSLREIYDFQMQRGDFAGAPHPLDQPTQQASSDADPALVSEHCLRLRHLGRTLQVQTRRLPGAGLVQTVMDVSDYVQAEAGRKRANQLLFATQALAELGGWEVDLQHNQVTWTDGVYRIFETTPQAFTPSLATVRPLFTEESLAIYEASFQPSGQPTSTHEFEIEMLTLKGRRIWLHSRGTTTWENDRPVKRTAIVQDITRRKQTEMALRDSEARWKLALESVGDGVWDLQVQSGEQYLSPNLLRMYGYDDGELQSSVAELDALVHPEDLGRLQLDRQAHLDGITLTYSNEHRVLCKDGNWKWVHSRGMVISRDAQGRALRMLGTHADITERKTADALVWQQAHFDALTGLPNRRLMRERLIQEIKKCRRSGHKLALLFIDLDHFKEVNDTLGHDRGDELLVEAAQRIQRCLRETDTVARMGGDEFTVIITGMADEANLQSILPKLLNTLSASFQLGLDQVFVSASMGVTVYPTDTLEVDDLLKNADQALYVAKAAGRNRFSFFTPALQEAAMQRAQLTHDLRAALPAQEFRVVYQPIVTLATGKIHKAEALIRWQHPKRGLISPAEFIPVAESSGLIVELGEWIFAQAAAQVKNWRAELHPEFQVSVNKSPLQFENPNPNHIPWIDQLRVLGLPGESVVVEITEGLLLSTSNGVVEQLLKLRDEGINVSLDDFGTGYSSLSYLQKFDIDFIKIDQSFVRHLKAGTTDLVLCQAIIAMAHALGMKVIAEGVETAEQRDLLKAAGCDYAQGYFYSRPVNPAEFEAMVQRSEQALDSVKT
ncbi:EAL domain-containing protein [Rhodoferax sp.]|uniref:EAL domain-containing protein n=1 Tax=Rhodoferax sp. TaxID=50421 RepID=UPI0025FEB6BE|nr:EAL domain-containing protein [Rhodoferax sp.]MCM2339857.1 EAL domain-containing protein [Rhodoferax sp.]